MEKRYRRRCVQETTAVIRLMKIKNIDNGTIARESMVLRALWSAYKATPRGSKAPRASFRLRADNSVEF